MCGLRAPVVLLGAVAQDLDDEPRIQQSLRPGRSELGRPADDREIGVRVQACFIEPDAKVGTPDAAIPASKSIRQQNDQVDLHEVVLGGHPRHREDLAVHELVLTLMREVVGKVLGLRHVSDGGWAAHRENVAWIDPRGHSRASASSSFDGAEVA